MSQWTQSSSGGPSGEGRDGRSLQRQHRDSSASLSPLCQWSPTFKQLRADSNSPLRRSCTPEDSWRSPDFHRRRAPPPPCPSASRHSHCSSSPPKDCSSLSHRCSPSGRDQRATRDHSPSPGSRSPSHMARRSSQGRNPSPRSRRTSPNRQHRYSPSRSPSPRTHRSRLSCSRSPRSRSTDCDHRRHHHEADLLRLCDYPSVAHAEMRTRTLNRIPLKRILASRRML